MDRENKEHVEKCGQIKQKALQKQSILSSGLTTLWQDSHIHITCQKDTRVIELPKRSFITKEQRSFFIGTQETVTEISQMINKIHTISSLNSEEEVPRTKNAIPFCNCRLSGTPLNYKDLERRRKTGANISQLKVLAVAFNPMNNTVLIWSTGVSIKIPFLCITKQTWCKAAYGAILIRYFLYV